jgi:hypothetical protein
MMTLSSRRQLEIVLLSSCFDRTGLTAGFAEPVLFYNYASQKFCAEYGISASDPHLNSHQPRCAPYAKFNF